MASDEEDEELAALRFAALASMKSKQKQKPVVEEDEDLKALKEAALRSLEKTSVTPHPAVSVLPHSSFPPHSSILPHSTHLHPVQCHSPNFYASQPPPLSQYGHSQYSQPPPNYQQNIQNNNVYSLHLNQQHQTDSHTHHLGVPTLCPATTGSVTIGSVARITTATGPGSRSNTPPATGPRGPAGRGGAGSRGIPPRGLPPRANNLIVISPMPTQGQNSGSQQTAGGLANIPLPKSDPNTSKPVLLRPQDKWCSDSNSLTASPSRPKASGKFSRFDSSSGSESEESESEDEVPPLNKSSDRDNDDSDTEKSVSGSKKKMSTDSDSDSNSEAESVKSKSESNSSSDGSDKDSGDSVKDSGNSDQSSDEDKSDSEEDSKLKDVRTTKRESETEEEKLERREADRLLEETMDSRQVLDTSSEKEDKMQAGRTTETISIKVTVEDPQRTAGSFDLSHKLQHHRARVKEQNGNDSVPGDLSTKLTNRRNRQEIDPRNSAPIASMPKDFKNIKIQKSVDDISEPQKPKLSQEALQKLEARKRKFESSPVSGSKEGKKTISLKGIVPRSKKRAKERPRSRSTSPVPKCYSRDLERYEKKKATKVRHKSGSKENKDQKVSKMDPLPKDRTDCRQRLKDRQERKSIEIKKKESESDSSNESKSEVCAQISDTESEDEGRSWRKEANKSRVVLNKDRGRPSRDTLDPGRYEPRYRQDYRSRSSQVGRFGDRQRRHDEPQIEVILPKHRRGGVRHRSVEVMQASESDSDGPKLSSSVVLAGGRQRTDQQQDRPSRRAEDSDNDTQSPKESSQRQPLEKSQASARKRTVISSDSGKTKQSKGSRKVTTDLDSQKTLSFKTKSKLGDHSKRKANFESRERSPLLSVTLDSDKDLPDIEASRSRSSVHERLGRQLNSSESIVDRAKYGERERSKTKTSDDGDHVSVLKESDESSKADDDLEQRIQRIKQKNAAILKRQEEVRQDKERYG